MNGYDERPDKTNLSLMDKVLSGLCNIKDVIIIQIIISEDYYV